MTLRDIGRQLGLSAMTVSLVLRDSPRISDATKKRVRAAIRGTNFEPNQLARALATGRSNLIGVIVPNSSDLYYAEVIRAIEDAASAVRYHVLLCNGSYRMETYTSRVRDMRRLHMKGIIAAPPFTSERPRLPQFWRDLIHSDFEVVLINRQLAPPVFHQVAADYMGGVEMLVAALAERGHRRVAYVSGHPAILPFRQRLDDLQALRPDARFRRGGVAVRGRRIDVCRRVRRLQAAVGGQPAQTHGDRVLERHRRGGRPAAARRDRHRRAGRGVGRQLRRDAAR